MDREVHVFRQADFAISLRLPEGTPYVSGSTIEDIQASLERGYAVYGEGCDGKVFVWPVENGYEADHFFLSPATAHRFDDIRDAADFAASYCES